MKQSSTSKPGRRGVKKSAVSCPSGLPVDVGDGPIPHEEIERLAHSFWEAHGCDGGSPEEDWLLAERELKERRAAKVRGAAAAQ
jgi:hypothetical protein